MNASHLLSVLIASVLSAAVLAGCGGVPKDAVATVDGEAVEMESFEQWMTVAAKASGKRDARVSKRSREYKALRDKVIGQLVSQRWIEGEAKDLGISVTDAEVEKAFDRQRRLSFPKAADYEKWRKGSGQSQEDVLQRVRFDLLSGKLRDKVAKGDDKVTEQQTARYYRANKVRFTQPEQRDLNVVVTKSRKGAEQAKTALAGGASWKAAAERYSIDPATRSRGGELRGVVRGQQEPALGKAVFEASRGDLTGPVKTKLGYHVFEVKKIAKASRQTLEQARPAIAQLLASEGQRKRFDAFLEKFRAKWREKTECREGYVTADCSNGPKPTPTPNAAR